MAGLEDISLKIHKTINSGQNWVLHETPIDVSKRINFIDSLLGWCATTGLAKTTNGGIKLYRTDKHGSSREIYFNSELSKSI